MQLNCAELEKESQISWNVLLFTESLDLALLISDMTSEEYIVVQTAVQVVILAPPNRSASVPDELSLGHFVLDVGRAQVHREEDQGEAEDVDRVHIHPWITLTKSHGKFLQQPLKCLSQNFIMNSVQSDL